MIESARILSPQFDDAVLYFTGAQIELLRNVVEYCRRIESYTTEYHLGYYLVPTIEDYNALMNIVADLEETLMGNPNTLWGYKDRYTEWMGENMSADEDYGAYSDLVPEGWVYVVNEMHLQNQSGARGEAALYMYDGVRMYPLALKPSLLQNEVLVWTGHLVLKEDDRAHSEMKSCLTGDIVRCGVWGYKMAVP